MLLCRRQLAYICRWVVEKEVHDDGQDIDDAPENIAPSPLKLGSLVERSSDGRAENSEWYGGGEHESIHWTSQRVWYKLTKNDVK